MSGSLFAFIIKCRNLSFEFLFCYVKIFLKNYENGNWKPLSHNAQLLYLIFTQYCQEGGVAQMVEHSLSMREVRERYPAPPNFFLILTQNSKSIDAINLLVGEVYNFKSSQNLHLLIWFYLTIFQRLFQSKIAKINRFMWTECVIFTIHPFKLLRFLYEEFF